MVEMTRAMRRVTVLEAQGNPGVKVTAQVLDASLGVSVAGKVCVTSGIGRFWVCVTERRKIQSRLSSAGLVVFCPSFPLKDNSPLKVCLERHLVYFADNASKTSSHCSGYNPTQATGISQHQSIVPR
jgi:hypothetical protein